MLDKSRIRDVLAKVQYKDWKFLVGGRDTELYLQVAFMDQGEEQRCRKWRLSIWMSSSEIVRTAWKAVLAAEEHEAAEKFLYRGEAIYNPHFDLDEMVTFSRHGNIEGRHENEKILLIGDRRIKLTFDGDDVHAEFMQQGNSTYDTTDDIRDARPKHT